MSLKIGELISTFLCALVTGVFWGPWLGLSLSIATFKPEVFLAIGHRMIGNLAPVMPFLMPAATLSIIPVLVLSFNQHQQTFYLTLAGISPVHCCAPCDSHRRSSDRQSDQDLDDCHPAQQLGATPGPVGEVSRHPHSVDCRFGSPLNSSDPLT